MATYLLIDGNSLTYRAFFALPTDLATASGQVTNAVFGFTSMLINLIRDHRPDGIVVAFDRPEKTFRHERIETYKANRSEAPDILRQQMGLVRQVADVLRLPVVDKAGFEADDLLATLATRIRDRGDDAIVVTGDRDSYQLVEDPHVKVLYNRRGVSDYVLYDEAGILERTGVMPTSYVQYAALRGDNSDNLPGIPGVGEKTAAKLINKYGGLDGIFANVGEQTPKLRENLVAHEQQARSNAEVMELLRDVPLDVTLDELRMGDVDLEEVRGLFDFLEFRLMDRLVEALGAPADGVVVKPDTEPLVVHVIEPTAAEAVIAVERLCRAGTPVAVAGALSGVGAHARLDGLAVVTDSGAGEVAWIPLAMLHDPELAAALGTMLAAGGPPLWAHDAKPLVGALLAAGWSVGSLTMDSAIAAYLLEPADSAYPLPDLLSHYARLELPVAERPPDGQLDLGGSSVSVGTEAAWQALAVARVGPPLLAALDARGLRRLNDEVEVPLVGVLARMEAVGIAVDGIELKALADQLAAECDVLTQAIWADAGREFNVNSTPQLRQILFDDLGLTPQKKTKTGYSTDAQSLEKLVGQHPIVDHLLAYREVEKLRSTYGEALLAEIAADGRIHATFNQTVARTGRLSSDAPNLHNIPVRSEVGRAFRHVFVAAEGFQLLVADYNQIELRCIAHLAEDPGLIAAFEAGEDIHTATAARIYDVTPAEVTFEQRAKAKMVSYGLAYGMEAYGLGQRLNIPVAEAQEILDAYFAAFPAVKDYMDRTVAEARERGYTETLFGRRRQIPQLSSPNFRIRQAGERQAMNAGIQGLAADIFKVALVHLDSALERAGLTSRIILQVHDEVVVEVADGELERVAELTTEALSGAFELRIPLAVNLATGPTWAAAKG